MCVRSPCHIHALKKRQGRKERFITKRPRVECTILFLFPPFYSHDQRYCRLFADSLATPPFHNHNEHTSRTGCCAVCWMKYCKFLATNHQPLHPTNNNNPFFAQLWSIEMKPNIIFVHSLAVLFLCLVPFVHLLK